MKKVLLFIFMIILSIVLIGCTKKTPDKVKVVSISVDQTSIPNVINVEELDEKLLTIKIIVENSDGSNVIVNLDKSMMFPHDLEKLQTKGTHTVTVSYGFVETTMTLNIHKDEIIIEKEVYSVKVLFPNDSPVNGVNVEFIQNNKVIAKTLTNELGVCSYELEKGEYLINLKDFPNGYIFLKNTYKVNNENKDIVIKLDTVLVIEDGDGSQKNPFKLDLGIYLLSFEIETISGMQYYSFTASESGTYTIESISYSNFSENIVDPYLIFITENGDFDKSGNEDSNTNMEFKYTFEAEAGKTYKFICFISVASSMPANFLLKISK